MSSDQYIVQTKDFLVARRLTLPLRNQSGIIEAEIDMCLQIRGDHTMRLSEDTSRVKTEVLSKSSAIAHQRRLHLASQKVLRR